MEKQTKTDEKKIESINEMQESFESIAKTLIRLPEEMLTRKVSRLGNSGHISIPAKHIGKEAQIFIYKNKEEEQPDNKL
jgi:putative transposon-encoded protein